MTFSQYRDEFLNPTVIMNIAAVGYIFVLKGDNMRPYRAVLVELYLGIDGIARMEWPAYSPYLKTIENLWDALDLAVCTYFPLPDTLTELQTTPQVEWQLRVSTLVDYLIENMITLCKHCMQGRGTYTPY